MIWHLLDSRSFGGIESHVATLAQAQRAAGVVAHVVLLADHGLHPMRPLLTQAGVPICALAGGWRGLRHALRRSRPRLIHTHGYKAGILGRLAARISGIPVVSTFHAGDPGTGRVAIYTAIDRLTARLATRIAVSASVAAQLPKGTRIIPNFVPIPDWIAPVGTAIGFVGRFVAEKGPDTFGMLASRLPTVPFVAYGDGPMLPGIRAALPSNLSLLGAVPSMQGRWSAIGLLCLPSRHEGLPIAALEAMAHGIPVAAFAVGGLPDLIDHGRNGFIVPAGDCDALADALRQWLAMADAARSSMAQSARATIAARFAAPPCAEEIIGIYREVGAV